MYLRDQNEHINRVSERGWFNKKKKKTESKRAREKKREREIESPSAASESGDMPSGRSKRRQLCLVWYF